jgi:tetratricopeptide (TPR) repeat protein/energy-coupling factor transporter ATP-binding protein EcfA2
VSSDAFDNPFPGLRPFEADEDHLFFGRETRVDDLLRRLRFNRFLAVVGTSGCGKSSLIRSGLIPALHGGQMVKAGSSWRIAIMRPGGHPFRELAAALAVPGVLDMPATPTEMSGPPLVEVALRRGARGLVDAVRQARLPPADNLLVVVDQFEELFRFQKTRGPGNARDEAVAFVRLLLESSEQSEQPVYIVVTMRSDFIGDCMEYPGLPEALNNSQYLVPRMTRDELRSAITGPVAVAGAQIATRLVQRLLNDMGSDQDQLPVLQHALMRTWDHWSSAPQPRGPIDLDDYEGVGGLRDALSRHAEEAFADASPGRQRQLVERMFRALSDIVADPRGGRRPCAVSELAAIGEASVEEVVRAVELFRQPGRSFLMPPVPVPLAPDTIIDLAHESLMRCWTRLRGWVEEERAAATVYLRLTRAAQWFDDGTAGLWRDPELGLGLKWRAERRPTAAWAARYDSSFERAIGFLERSEHERDRLLNERRAERRRQWRGLQLVAGALAFLLLVSGVTTYVARRESQRARDESARAERNLQLARTAVDESLLVVDREPSRLGVDVPEIVGFRRELLEKAQRFYLDFIRQAPQSEELQREIAYAQLRLGHIDRALDALDRATADYRSAIAAFAALTQSYPARYEYRGGLADAYNWLGESLRRSGGGYNEARTAYDKALELAAGPVPEAAVPAQQLALARVRANRGILMASHAGQDGASLEAAEADLREAIRLLEPLAARSTLLGAQDLGRVYNNLGNVALGDGRIKEARDLYTRAVGIHEDLTRREPTNREYGMELVQFYNNLSSTLRDSGEIDEALRRNLQARERIEVLARPAPSVSIERADSYSLQGLIAEGRSPAEAAAAYQRSLELFTALSRDDSTRRFPEFHERFGDLLVNLAELTGRSQAPATQKLLEEGLREYAAVAERSASGAAADTRVVRDTLTRVRAAVDDNAGAIVDGALAKLQP